MVGFWDKMHYFWLRALSIATPKSWADAGFAPRITKKEKIIIKDIKIIN
jgi:hypothetical protein